MREDAPSATATLVASGVAFQSTQPAHHHLVDPRAAELTRQFLAAAKRRVRSGASRLDRTLVALQEWITVPGITLHYVLRKRRIEQCVRAALADGYRQLIVLGGGLDTLAIRLSGEITAIEIDHPATQRLKRSVARTDYVEFLPVDFTRESLSDALSRSQRYRKSEPALFLCEAVFMYLRDDDVRSVFRQLALREAKTRLIFTFMGPTPNFANATWFANLWLRFMREPAQWALDPSAAAQFAREQGFRLLELARDRDYHDGYDAARGEHIAIVERTVAA
jgi:methyltransferase (TIGR00027 family)